MLPQRRRGSANASRRLRQRKRHAHLHRLPDLRVLYPRLHPVVDDLRVDQVLVAGHDRARRNVVLPQEVKPVLPRLRREDRLQPAGDLLAVFQHRYRHRRALEARVSEPVDKVQRQHQLRPEHRRQAGQHEPLAVARPVHAVGREGPLRVAVARQPEDLHRRQRHNVARRLQRERSAEPRDLDVVAATRARAIEERGGDGPRRKHAGRVRDDGHDEVDRRLAIGPLQPEHARHRGQEVVVGRQARARALGAVQRQIAVDDGRVATRDRRVIDAPLFQRIGERVDQHHVGARRKLQRLRAPVVALQVEDDAPFAAVQHVEGGLAANAVAGGRLDLDHVCPLLSEEHRRVRPGYALREVEHPHALESACIGHGESPRKPRSSESLPPHDITTPILAEPVARGHSRPQATGRIAGDASTRAC